MEAAWTAQLLVHDVLMRRTGASTMRGADGDEAGFTLIEVGVVATVMLVIVTSFMGALNSLSNASMRVEALVNNQELVRFGLDQLQRDVRAANPVDPASSSSAYRGAVQVELGPNPGARTYIRWFYDTVPASATYESLLRQVMSGPGANATVLRQAAVITRVRNLETSTPVFTYYDSSGADLVASNPTIPANVANCAIRLHVQVNSDARPGPQPFSEAIDVELRNRLPGGIVGCAS